MSVESLLSQFLGGQLAPGIDAWDAPAKSNRSALNIFLRSSLQFIHALISGQLRDCVLLQGKFLLYCSGPLSLCDTGIARRALAGLRQRQPFVLIRANAHIDAAFLPSSTCESCDVVRSVRSDSWRSVRF